MAAEISAAAGSRGQANNSVRQRAMAPPRGKLLTAVCIAAGGVLLATTTAFVSSSSSSASSGRISLRQPSAPKAHHQLFPGRPLDTVATRRAAGTLDQPDQKNEYRLRVGHAVDVLRADVPALLTSSGGVGGHLPDLSIFNEDIAFVDARAPGLVMSGMPMYRQFLSAIRWSVQTTCDESELEILSIKPPVNNELLMRWKLRLWPKDVMSYTKDLIGPSLHGWESQKGMPTVFEGYSRYELDPWSGEIVKHSIDITNPPTYISELLRNFYTSPEMTRVNLPQSLGVMRQEAKVASSFTGSTAAGPVSAGRAMAGAGQVRAAASVVARHAGASWSLPQSCEDDFECNGGRANFPLQCCEFPVVGNFCCQPPDEFRPSTRDPAYVPLPVPITESWRQN
eukprot:CAMPEP_0115089680 /NCGR_PEP_ID=MMETSP0227-20121206/24873_1 /TAXON_ID=89957 /ORGANISM="Polarella glacialis, Strain CCMP 1383" /LENGTH=395 /DNA_ID=CAMNT_0002480471 /DNA_START=41 /DNA_END=1228 /DNA_ORIENTATION=-